MAETDTRKYETPPGGGVLPDVPYWLKVLADAVDADMAILFQDSGWIDMAPVSAWTVATYGARYRLKAGVVYWQIHLTRGSWSGNAPVFLLPDGFRPQYLAAAVSGYSADFTEILIRPDGQMLAAAGTGGLTAAGSFPVAPRPNP